MLSIIHQEIEKFTSGYFRSDVAEESFAIVTAHSEREGGETRLFFSNKNEALSLVAEAQKVVNFFEELEEGGGE